MRKSRAIHWQRLILSVAALLVPSLTLIPLGGWLLWEKGWLLYWAFGALSFILIITLLEWRWQKANEKAAAATHAAREAESAAEDGEGPATGGDAFIDRERRAWRAVRRIAVNVDPDSLSSIEAFSSLAVKTLDAVSRRMNPEKNDALWAFTVPEALAISEDASRRLALMVESHIPFGDRLTLAQLRSAYRWRGAINVAERAYDVWRVLRLVNPATAVAHEARERLSRAVVNWGRDQLVRRFAEGFVEEIGRAAIDLYGRRARHGRSKLTRREAMPDASPLLVVVGADEPRGQRLKKSLNEFWSTPAGQSGDVRPFSSIVVAHATDQPAKANGSGATNGFAHTAAEQPVMMLWLISPDLPLAENLQALHAPHLAPLFSRPNALLIAVATRSDAKTREAIVAALGDLRSTLPPHVVIMPSPIALRSDADERGIEEIGSTVTLGAQYLALTDGRGVTAAERSGVIAAGRQAAMASGRIARSIFWRS